MTKAATAKYQIQQIMSASPARLVAMLFDKAIMSLNEAIRAIEQGDIEARWRANGRAMEIVTHLLATLDMEKGGQIAANLEQLYVFMLRRMPDTDLQNSPVPAREVIGLLEPLRKSWHEVASRPAEAIAAATAAAATATTQPPAAPQKPASAPAPAKAKDEIIPPMTGIALSA
jgi:flagellar protein FliS